MKKIYVHLLYVQGPEAETPLEVANEIGFEEIADLLKNYGADLSQTD